MSALAREAAGLIRSQRWAALATVRDGEPSASMVAYALGEGEAALLLFLSQLAAHTGELLANPACAIVVSEPDTHDGDPQRLQRATLHGHARPIAKQDPAFFNAAESYVARFPDALPRFELGDFVLFAFVPDSVRYVGGFARAARFGWSELREA